MGIRSQARRGGQVLHLGGLALHIGTFVREFRKARAQGDYLRIVDAAVNVITIAIAITIVVQEIRGRRNDKGDRLITGA